MHLTSVSTQLQQSESICPKHYKSLFATMLPEEHALVFLPFRSLEVTWESGRMTYVSARSSDYVSDDTMSTWVVSSPSLGWVRGCGGRTRGIGDVLHGGPSARLNGSAPRHNNPGITLRDSSDSPPADRDWMSDFTPRRRGESYPTFARS
jgi:hypothetical protein